MNEDREPVSCKVLPNMNKQDGTPGREGKGAFFLAGEAGGLGRGGPGAVGLKICMPQPPLSNML